ncbi:MAG: 30S ribosomal protein S20 [Planctomycetota bacterium]
MAHSLSAKKRIRQNIERNARNRSRKARIREAVTEVDEAITAGKADEAQANFRVAEKLLDRLASKNVIHKNAAARKVSQLQKRINAAGTK